VTAYQQAKHLHFFICNISTVLPQGKVIFLSLLTTGWQQKQLVWKNCPWGDDAGLLSEWQNPSHFTTVILFLQLGIPGGLISILNFFLWHFFGFKPSQGLHSKRIRRARLAQKRNAAFFPAIYILILSSNKRSIDGTILKSCLSMSSDKNPQRKISWGWCWTALSCPH